MIKEVEAFLTEINNRSKLIRIILRYRDNPPEVVVESNIFNTIKTEGIDLLECFQKLQITIEEKGYLLALNGSRKDIQASGFLRDSTNGISTYLLSEDFDSEKTILNIFNYYNGPKLGTIEEQKEYYKKWKMMYKSFLKNK